MTFRNNQKYKQTLNIEIEQSPQKYPEISNNHHSQTFEDGQNQQHQYQDDEDREPSDENSQKDDIQGESNDVSDQQILSEPEDQLNQEAQRQYNSGQNQQDYLILQNQYGPQISDPAHQPLKSKNTYTSSMDKLQQSQKDQEVQKIIQDVLYKRKQKQKQKELLQKILNSDKKSHQTSSLFTYEPKNQANPIVSRFKLNENINSLNYMESPQKQHELAAKCKELETKIKLLSKKRGTIERQRKNKEQGIKEKYKKAAVNKTKQELSLQKLQKRLQKALKLNINLSKRVKLQRSKLSSILSMSQMTVNSKKNFNSSLDQESTIKHVESSARFNNSQGKHLNSNTQRSKESQHLQIFKVGKSPSLIHRRSASGESLGSASGRQEVCNSCNQKKGLQTKGSVQLTTCQKPSKKYSATKYKSPILQFNSYLIEKESSMSPDSNHNGNKNKQNIYIEDDMMIAEESSENMSKEIKKQSIEDLRKREEQEKQIKRKQQELKDLIESYKILEKKEKDLLQKIQENGATIKHYENLQFQRAIC